MWFSDSVSRGESHKDPTRRGRHREPTTIIIATTIAAAAIAAASTAYTTVSSNRARRDAAAQDRGQAEVSALAAERDAIIKEQEAALQGRVARMESARRMSRLRASAGKTGLDTGAAGSILEVEMEGAALSEFDAQLQEYGARVGVAQQRYRARAYRAGGSLVQDGVSSVATAINLTGAAAQLGGGLTAAYGTRQPTRLSNDTFWSS